MNLYFLSETKSEKEWKGSDTNSSTLGFIYHLLQDGISPLRPEISPHHFNRGHSGHIQTHTDTFLPNLPRFGLHPCWGGKFSAARRNCWRKVKGTDSPSGTRSVSPASFTRTCTELGRRSWHRSLSVSLSDPTMLFSQQMSLQRTFLCPEGIEKRINQDLSGGFCMFTHWTHKSSFDFIWFQGATLWLQNNGIQTFPSPQLMSWKNAWLWLDICPVIIHYCPTHAI